MDLEIWKGSMDLADRLFELADRLMRKVQRAERKEQRAERMDEARGAGRPKFRFMDLEIWQDAIRIGDRLLELAEKLEQKRMYRFADQLRGSSLSMSNNPVK